MTTIVPLSELLTRARSLSRERWGRRVTFFLPGMFRLDGFTGRYPAVSLTGARCALCCDHCRGTILSSMFQAADPILLMEYCQRIWEHGCQGVLLSGGCAPDGTLPWETFLDAISLVKERTGLTISVHCGLVDFATAQALKNAGVDQALIDVVGDDETYKRVCHVDFGVERIQAAMQALARAGLPMAPHVVCGLDYGRMRGEMAALEMISRFDVEQLVVVSLMPLPETPMAGVTPPRAEEVARILAEARLRLPGTRISLGCARQRGNRRMEILALEAGVNRLALPSDEAIAHARNLGLETAYQSTCCSVSADLSASTWPHNTPQPAM